MEDRALEPTTPGLASPSSEKVAPGSVERAGRRLQGTPTRAARRVGGGTPRKGGLASPSPRTGKGSQTMEFLNSEIMRYDQLLEKWRVWMTDKSVCGLNWLSSRLERYMSIETGLKAS